MTESDISIIKVSDAIDGLLDRPHWTRREFAFYQMLVSKVKEYQNRLPKPEPTSTSTAELQPLRDLSSDIADIYNNIAPQPWYMQSDNQGTITDLFRHMKIVECEHRGGPNAHNYRYKLDLKLNDRTHLIMDTARDPRASSSPPYHFRVYYELNGNKGHIAAFTPGKSKGHKLPEYDHLIRMFPSLKRYEIVCLAIELVLYYDVDGIMAKLPIGNSYPITLHQLLIGIVNGL